MSISDHGGAARSHVLLRLDESAVRAEIAEVIATDETVTRSYGRRRERRQNSRSVLRSCGVHGPVGGAGRSSVPRRARSHLRGRAAASRFHLINPSVPSPDEPGLGAGLVSSKRPRYEHSRICPRQLQHAVARCGLWRSRTARMRQRGHWRAALCSLRDCPGWP
jgi:hypothetical protein